MAETAADPLIDSLVADFGGNYSFALELLSNTGSTGNSVDRAGASTSTDDGCGPAGARTGRARRVRLGRRAPRRAGAPGAFDPVRARSQALVVPAILPATSPPRSGRRGPHRREHGGQPHHPHRHLHAARAGSHAEENRRVLNKHRDATGGSKISFNAPRGVGDPACPRHVPAAQRRLRGARGAPHPHPARRGAAGHRGRRPEEGRHPHAARANIKDANKLDFAGFLKAFDDLVARSRKGTISPDDFIGTTVSLTNPGTVGTTASAPRLMPGQGLIVATGASDYPAEYRSMAPARCRCSASAR